MEEVDTGRVGVWGREKWGREGVGQSPPFPAAVLPRWGAEWVGARGQVGVRG